MNKLFYTLLFLLSATLLKAEQRIVYTINDSWSFMKGMPFEAHLPSCNDTSWDIVSIPHTWNDKDCDDDTPGMYRGPAWYRKSVFIDSSKSNKRTLVCFEGANQEVKFYVNGHYVGEHIGGYTRFCFDITRWVKFGEENLFAVNVTNQHNPNIPPLSADFNFYGGIYRDVYLQFVNDIHFTTSHHASTGVYVRTPKVSEKEAVVDIAAMITNDNDKDAKIIVENTILDHQNHKVASQRNNLKIKKGESVTHHMNGIKVANPRLWDIDDPYRYRLHTSIISAETQLVLDEISTPIGLRWFKFDAETGFFLNGKHRKLVGTARHQDYFEKGNALRDEMHVQDVMLLKEMGGNFLRVSHYPQDPVVMEMCDKLGIVTSVEIPVVNAITETQEFIDNSVHMAIEMIHQDFNRPSVMIWGYMNEILLRRPYKDGKQLDDYLKYTEKTARALDEAIRKEDPSRYTMMAYHNGPHSYERAHLTEIPMIQGWNLYQGWYEPDINEFQRLLDRAHREYKGKVLIVTEYGPGVDPRVHSYESERFDFSQEYGLIYHRHYLKEMAKRDFIAGSSMWNLNDFYAEPRIDAVPHVNNKGVVGLNREKKDTYLYYQAMLTDKPYVMIGNRAWKARGGVENQANGSCVQAVPVFSNAKTLSLVVNGQNIGQKKVENGCAHFDVPFINGENVLEARAEIDGKQIIDLYRVNFQLVGKQLSEETLGQGINIMMGTPQYFDDRVANLAWIPEQEYKAGSWGYVGGEPFRRKTKFGTMLGTDINILGTDMNPIYQTLRENIEAFKADVPDGDYSVYLYMAELQTKEAKAKLAYNLGADIEEAKENGSRIFDIKINNTLMVQDFDIVKEAGYATACIKKFDVTVKNGQGLNIQFLAKEGKTILNAIRIYKK